MASAVALTSFGAREKKKNCLRRGVGTWKSAIASASKHRAAAAGGVTETTGVRVPTSIDGVSTESGSDRVACYLPGPQLAKNITRSLPLSVPISFAKVDIL